MKKENAYLILIIVLGFLLRFWSVAELPAGFTADEASHGYDAYSLLKTGKDMWGESWPVAFRSFGEYKLPAYIYSLLPFVWLGGLNELMVRLPNVLFGTGAVWVTYFFVYELFRNSRFKNQNSNIALLSALFLTISPWHIQMSRGAFEGNLSSFFLPAGLWCWFVGVKYGSTGSPQVFAPKGMVQNIEKLQIRWFSLSALLLGINLYTYHAARVLTLLFLPVLAWLTYRRDVTLKQLYIPVAVFAVFLIPMIWSVVTGGGARGWDVAIINPTDEWRSVSNRQHEGLLAGEPALVSKFFSNKAIFVLREFATNYLSYLSAGFLFVHGAGDPTYGLMTGRGLLYWFELPLILVSLWHWLRYKDKKLGLLWLLVLLAPIPASLSKGGGMVANRVAVMLPFIHVLSAVGVVVVFKLLVIRLRRLKFNLLKSLNFNALFICVFVILIFGSFVFFLEDYLVHGSKIQAKGMSYGFREAAGYLDKVEDRYDQVIVSRKFNEPQIFLIFYMQKDPEFAQNESRDWMRYEEEGLSFVDQLGEYRLGKYRFMEIHPEHLTYENTLIVARPEDFLTKQQGIIKVIMRPDYPESVPAIWFIDAQTDPNIKITSE